MVSHHDINPQSNLAAGGSSEPTGLVVAADEAASEESLEKGGPRRRLSSTSPTWLGEWTGTELVIMLIALVTPLLLLATLGVCATRPDWVSRLARGPAEASSNTGQQAAKAEEAAKPEESIGQLGQRAAGDPQMKYDGKGRAHLGEYSIRIYDPGTTMTFRTDFSLEGETTCANPQAFQQWVANHHCLFREQVAVTFRSGDVSEFIDPKLTVLSRKLIAQVNRTLGEPFLKSVKFKGFRLYESVQNSEFVLWEDANLDEP